MSNPTMILNGDQIFCDELIRENARLTVQHEADVQRMKELRAAVIKAESEAAEIAAVDESVAELERGGCKRSFCEIGGGHQGPALCHGGR